MIWQRRAHAGMSLANCFWVMIKYNHTMSSLKYVVFAAYWIFVCVRVWVHRVKVLPILTDRPVVKMKYNIYIYTYLWNHNKRACNSLAVATDLSPYCSPTLSSPSFLFSRLTLCVIHWLPPFSLYTFHLSSTKMHPTLNLYSGPKQRGGPEVRKSCSPDDVPWQISIYIYIYI